MPLGGHLAEQGECAQKMFNRCSPCIRARCGVRHAYEASHELAFAPLLQRYGLVEDAAVAQAIEAAVQLRCAPQDFEWPASRRGRAKARIVLRKLKVQGVLGADDWLENFD